MKRISIRTLCLVLCLSMILSLGAPAFAAEAEETTAATEATETTETTETTEATEAEETTETTAATEAEETTEATEAATTETTVPEEETASEITAETEPVETAPETTAETKEPAAEVTVQTASGESVQETTAETEPEETVPETTEATIGADAETADALPKLDTPTELTWGKKYDYSTGGLIDSPGCFCFKPGATTLEDYRIEIYQVGVDAAVRSTTYRGFSGEYVNVNLFITSNLGSGTYYFTVTAVGDGTTYQDSDTVTSANWTYTKPTQSLGTPSNLSWGKETYNSTEYLAAQWTNPSDSTFNYIGGVEVSYYYATTAEGEKKLIGGTSGSYGTNTSDTVPDSYISKYGDGYWFFKVRLLSNDLTQCDNGEWSDYSPAYHLSSSTSVKVEPGEVYRLYNPVSGEHLLATSQTEINTLTASGWSVDGLMCYMPTSGTPIYRLYNQVSGEHLYTMNESEIENLTAGDWTKDGVMCYSADSSGTPIYRLYNASAEAISSHLLSTSQTEMDSLVAAGGWEVEGIALYAAK